MLKLLYLLFRLSSFPSAFAPAADPIHLVGEEGPESAEGHTQHGQGGPRKHSIEDSTAGAGPNRARQDGARKGDAAGQGRADRPDPVAARSQQREPGQSGTNQPRQQEQKQKPKPKTKTKVKAIIKNQKQKRKSQSKESKPNNPSKNQNKNKNKHKNKNKANKVNKKVNKKQESHNRK